MQRGCVMVAIIHWEELRKHIIVFIQNYLTMPKACVNHATLTIIITTEDRKNEIIIACIKFSKRTINTWKLKIYS